MRRMRIQDNRSGIQIPVCLAYTYARGSSWIFRVKKDFGWSDSQIRDAIVHILKAEGRINGHGTLGVEAMPTPRVFTSHGYRTAYLKVTLKEASIEN